MIRTMLPAAMLPLLMGAGTAQAADAMLTLKNHAWTPDHLTVPAGQKVRITVHNADGAADEFESEKLGREKIVPAGGTITVLVGPLEAGDYPFVADFHRATGKGTITAK